jgi:UDP-N-acetylmuramyl pentapeptide phosphotransferase/UDP-N-acetylglucosamine-1-phosphate transferase
MLFEGTARKSLAKRFPPAIAAAMALLIAAASTVATLLFMALLRIRTPEQLPGHPPGELGLLGDGLVTGITACISLALALMNIMGNNTMVALLTLCLAGACLGFLPYNFSPARIFLGDSGSLFIGLILACTVMLSQHKATTGTFVVVPLILLGLPLYDTATVVFGRMRRGQPVFRADKSHVHHRLLNQGLSQKQTAWILYGITVVLGVMAVLIVARQVQNAPPGLNPAMSAERAVLISKQQFEFLLMGGVVLVSGVGLAIWRAWKLYTKKISSNTDHIYAGPYESPKPHLSSHSSAGR